MEFDNALIAQKLRRWETYLNTYQLPKWEAIPDFGLYMEQVIVLLKEYLDYLPPELKEEQVITAAAINNYVRKKIMPEPIRKKYYRSHIAYLIMICSLKQSLSISTLQTMLPLGLSEDALKDLYNAFAARQKQTSDYFTQQVRGAAAGILEHEVQSGLATDSTTDLITTAAIISGLSRLLAEKLLLLADQPADAQQE